MLRTQGRSDEDIFRMAQRNVETFSVIGVQENMADFEAKIERRYGVDLTLGAVNQNEQRIPIQDISFSTKSRILDWVYMDMELYDHVLRLCRERAEPARPTGTVAKPKQAAPPPPGDQPRAVNRNGSTRH